jgi:hypothetical protein
MKLATALSMAGFALLLGACDDSATGSGSPGCVTNVDCELPLQCVEGRCLLECRDTIDCQTGETCFEGSCRARPPICGIDEDCIPFGEVCDRVRNICVPPGTARCSDDLAPCPAGERCVEGLCRIPTADFGRPPLDASVPQDATAPADASPPTDQGPAIDQGPQPDAAPRPDRGLPDQGVPPDCPEGLGQYGERCLRGGDCASGFCVENKLRGMRLCTTLCNLDAAQPSNTCPGLDVCVAAEAQGGGNPDCPQPPDAPAVGEIVGVCIGNETGLACDFAAPRAGECLGGTCLRPPNTLPWAHVQDVCAIGCTDNRKCPAGTTCRDVPPAGRVCAPQVVGLTACEQPEQCAGLCDAGLGEGCLQPDNRGAGYCVCLCRNADDCPGGHACQPDPSGNKICIPFAGYRCPDEVIDPVACQSDRTCGAGEVCISGLCQYIQCPSLTCLIDDNEPRLNQCSAACENARDCPADYNCQDFPGVGGFCIPLE